MNRFFAIYGNSVISFADAEELLSVNITPPFFLYKYSYNQIVSCSNTAYGDIMEEKTLKSEVEKTSTMLRIKEYLNLTDITYDYISAYVTNAKGKDEISPFWATLSIW